MSLLVTGSIGIDTVESPHGRAENVLGGTAVYFSLAARHYAPVRLVAAVGDDFPSEYRAVLDAENIDLAGLEIRRGSKTFRWSGRYTGDMNAAETVRVDVNILGEAGAKVPAAFADSQVVFLANTHPDRQREVLGQLHGPRTVVCDTIDLWIETERESLLETLRAVTGVIVNDGEVRQLTGRVNLIEAGEAILALGPRFAIIKKGEHGALLVTKDGAFPVPAFPARRVVDPTGAGDSFAGGVLGYVAAEGRDDVRTLRNAMVRGTVAASFALEDFSVQRVRQLTKAEIEQRVAEFLGLLRFG